MRRDLAPTTLRWIALVVLAAGTPAVGCAARGRLNGSGTPSSVDLSAQAMRAFLEGDSSGRRYCWIADGRGADPAIAWRLRDLTTRLTPLWDLDSSLRQGCSSIIDIQRPKRLDDVTYEVELRQRTRLRDTSSFLSGDVYRLRHVGERWVVDPVVRHWVE